MRTTSSLAFSAPRRAWRWNAAGLTLAALLAGACASNGARTPPIARLVIDRGPASIELDSVPFYPQRDDQCGPAALATVLTTPDRPVTPDQLASEVYLPGRRGSVQLEMVAATRSHDRLPYLLAPSLADAVAQLGAGRPVLVLQNLGLAIWPFWHYSVLVGYDAPSNTVILRSGTTERLVKKAARFDRFWARAGRWGMVALEPGELPAAPDLDRYMTGAAALEAVGKLDAARAAYDRALLEWPDSAWPWLGLANLSQAAGRLDQATGQYREALARDPANVAALNNLAETLDSSGCAEQARVEIERASRAAKGTALEAQVAATATRIGAHPALSAGDGGHCPAID